jgi:hypothetical protein
MLAINDILTFLPEYWKTGVALADERVLADSKKYVNPMFGGLHTTLTLHYSTQTLSRASTWRQNASQPPELEIVTFPKHRFISRFMTVC